jgi:predicted nucleic acid-binding protein
LSVATYYLDSSAVVKRYVQETGTVWVRNLTSLAAGNFLYVSRITAVEVTAAIARRRGRRALGIADAAVALNQFRVDFTQDYRIAELTASVLGRAAGLADSHALRAYDAVQLASALEIHRLDPSLTLISADHELNAAAIAEGLAVDDPNAHP